MGLTFHDRINTQLIYRFELAQVVARRITKPQRKFLGSNLTGCYFLFSFFYFLGVGEGWGSDFIILFMSYCFSFYLCFIFLFVMPLTCLRHIYKTSVTTQTTVNSEIYANSVKRHICDVKIRD